MLPSTSCQFWLANHAALAALNDAWAERIETAGATRQMLAGIAAWPEASVSIPPASIRDASCAVAKCGISSAAAESATNLACGRIMRPGTTGFPTPFPPEVYRFAAAGCASDSGERPGD